MYYYRNGQLDLSDRIAIETGICRGESFKKIARRIHRHPTTVPHEVKTNRTLIRGRYYLGKDCSHVRNCAKRNIEKAPVDVNWRVLAFFPFAPKMGNCEVMEFSILYS